MKGKPLIKDVANSKDFYMNYDLSDEEALLRNMSQSDEDEGIDEGNDAEHFHANTPATPIHSFSNKFNNPYSQKTEKTGVLNDYYYQELVRFRNNKNKPAILPQSGTSGPAHYSERPKPQLKPKTLTDEFKLKKIKETLLDMDNLDDDERHQILMENEVKNLIEEAKKFAKLSPVIFFF